MYFPVLKTCLIQKYPGRYLGKLYSLTLLIYSLVENIVWIKSLSEKIFSSLYSTTRGQVAGNRFP